MAKIESLLSARLFVRPQVVGDRIYFESNLSGHISLFGMNFGGSVPEPLLPPDIALHNPHLIEGKSFFVFPKLKKIIVMIDRDGDENYLPYLIPIDGGYPEPAFGEFFNPFRVHIDHCDASQNILYLLAESQTEEIISTYQGNLKTGELSLLGSSPWGMYPDGMSKDHSKIILNESYSLGDNVIYLFDKDTNTLKLLYGTSLNLRGGDRAVPLNGISNACFISNDPGIVFITTLFDDKGGLGYLNWLNPGDVQPVQIEGIRHKGTGELTALEHLEEDRFLLYYNIDGISWLYEGRYRPSRSSMVIDHALCGKEPLANGVLESVNYAQPQDRFSLAFSSAIRPTQIYTIEGKDRKTLIRHTHERILGIPEEATAKGEDSSFTSFDGTRISARLYLPAESLGYTGKRPVIFYIHGGPQSQERPDFAWFSIPLIQFLALKGFAIFVPNVRGSTGYGLNYAKQVDRDWGGQDRLDHVFARTEFLPNDDRLDISRSGVVGRSYGGYMTLTLAGRHPELWSAAVDMFGPYDLLTFLERIPETWKPSFKQILGDPDDPTDRQFLIERSPRTYLEQLKCPLYVIQGRNDPRVVEQESSDLVADLRAKGKMIEYLIFEDEGHDVLKFDNRVKCYNSITTFFTKYLHP